MDPKRFSPVTGSDPDAAHPPANYLVSPALAHAVPAVFLSFRPLPAQKRKLRPAFVNWPLNVKKERCS